MLITELYRGLLGREPDPDGLRDHCAALRAGTKLAAILHSFATSAEFVAKLGGMAAAAQQGVDMDPKLPIDLDLTEAQLRRLWAHIGATWAALGQDDPYWSVLSDPRFHLPQMSDAAVLDFFYESGQRELSRLDAWLARNGLALAPGAVIAEYGCGVGRLTGWLAGRAALVKAFDISPTHQARARHWLEGRGITNVAFNLVRAPADLEALGGSDLFYSFIVLQHNPPPIIALILDRAFAHLNPGGIAFFQLPTHRPDYSFSLENYLAGLGARGEIEMHCLPQASVFAIAARHRVAPVQIEPDVMTGDWGGASRTFLMRKAP